MVRQAYTRRAVRRLLLARLRQRSRIEERGKLLFREQLLSAHDFDDRFARTRRLLRYFRCRLIADERVEDSRHADARLEVVARALLVGRDAANAFPIECADGVCDNLYRLEKV